MNQLQEINLSSLAIIYSTGEENELAWTPCSVPNYKFVCDKKTSMRCPRKGDE
jgi:hypothetical protein